MTGAARFTAEIRLLTVLARPDFTPDHARAAGALASGIDLDVFANLLRFHRIAGHVRANLSNVGVSTLPAAVTALCRRVADNGARRTEAQLKQLSAVGAALEARGVEAMVLKGPASSARLFGDPARRVLRDLDLMVRAGDALPAFETLRSAGYRPEHPALQGPMDLRRMRRLQGWSNNIAFINPDAPTLFVELHWRPGRFQVEFPVAEADIWARAHRLAIGDRRWRVLDPVHDAIFLAMHGCKHEWKRLHWLVDIAALMHGPGADWARVAALCEEAGLKRAVQRAAILAQLMLDASWPAELSAPDRAQRRAAEAIAQRRFHNAPANDPPLAEAAIEWRNLALVAGPTARARLIAGHIQPGPYEWALIDLPRWAEPAYYPLRLARIAAVLTASALSRFRPRLQAQRDDA